MKSTLFLVGDGAMFRRNISAPSSVPKFKVSKYPAEAGSKFVHFSLCLLFDPENGSNTHFRNVRLCENDEALKSRRPYSSFDIFHIYIYNHVYE
jgi:hypothetical protein